MRVAIIKPPIRGHINRGTGVYTSELAKALNLMKDTKAYIISDPKDINQFDLIHYPYFDPFFLTLPMVKKKPTVVTVHDLIPLKYPQFFPKGLKGELKWQMQKYSLKQTSAVITDSYSSKEDIIKYTKISDQKINVVYLGISEDFHQIKDQKYLQSLRNKFLLPKKFIMYTGDVNYNKNIPALLKAFQKLKTDFPDFSLLLVGKGFVTPTPQRDEIISLIKTLNIENSVIMPGLIDKSDLIAFYNLAAVYIQPSLAEGFGLPVLEAISSGTLVIVSNASSLKEIVPHDSIFVNPQSADDIYKGLKRALKLSADDIIKLKKSSRDFTASFTWQKCASKTRKVYEKVLKA